MATLENDTHQRSLKDFLQLYNTITEFCFNRCVSNFNERWASQKETACIDVCTENYIQYNQRFMFTFVEAQERRKREQEAEMIEAAKKLEAQQLEEAVKQQMAAASGGSDNQQVDPAGGNKIQMEQAAQLLENLSAGSPAAGLSTAVGQAETMIAPKGVSTEASTTEVSAPSLPSADSSVDR